MLFQLRCKSSSKRASALKIINNDLDSCRELIIAVKLDSVAMAVAPARPILVPSLGHTAKM
jgi:hypothetical protein